jgi:hypothetical protein
MPSPLRGGGEYGKNGMMQELKCKSKMYLMISLRQNIDCSQKYIDFLAIRGVKWRFTSRCNHTASRIDESGIAGSRSNGHVALPYLPQVQVGHMIMEQHKTVKKCLNTKAILPQRKSRNSLSSYYGNHGDHDDRVVPAHSFKFAAELQEKQTGNNPTLIALM